MIEISLCLCYYIDMTTESLEAAKGKLANRWLLVVLVFLVIIIVGLIGAIIYFGDGIGVPESGDMGVMIERDQLAANDANDEVGEIFSCMIIMRTSIVPLRCWMGCRM